MYGTARSAAVRVRIDRFVSGAPEGTAWFRLPLRTVDHRLGPARRHRKTIVRADTAVIPRSRDPASSAHAGSGLEGADE
ncbi:hypothetical protein GCM10018953_01670 [Streptosporangium nondiastaticum]|uniref:hypothetical protein n=1 Tax=Streptosporangium TaxID=2000 RepID=UPI0031F75E48